MGSQLPPAKPDASHPNRDLLSNKKSMSVRFPLNLALLVALTASAFAAPPRQAILPISFAGWQRSTAKSGVDPAAVDAANAALLKEYGFKDYEIAEYKRDGSTLKLRAMRFGDAPGAFGTFCYYAAPQMKDDLIGDHAATSGDHVIFSRANIIVDALFDQPTVMSAAELRELAQELPVAKSGTAPPEIVGYMPMQALLPNSLRYVEGPVGLETVGTALPAQIVDFTRSAEAAVGEYRTRWGTAKLGVVEYPTPQVAADAARGLVQFVSGPKPGEFQGTIVFPASSGGEIAFRRSGPLLIYVSGASSDEEARTLAQSVNYVATVTWNQAPQVTANGVVKLVVYSIVLSLMLIAIFLVLMIFFGGSYVALRRFFPKLKLPAQDNELIKLNLKE